MDLLMKKSQQSKKTSLWRQVPLIKTALKRRTFYKTVRESLQWHHNERDSEELAKTIPPKKENLELHCVWVTEAYGPSNIDRLIVNLKDLGWDIPERNIGNRENLADWIKHGRSSGLGGSWINGGIILSRGDKARFVGSDIRRTKLPGGVDYGYLSIRNVTSSLTLVTIQFIYCDETGASLNRPFNSSYSTKVKYLPSLLRSSGATYIGAVEQKRQAIKNELDSIHLKLHEWFNKNMPGHFSALGMNDFPTVDLITSRLYEQQSEDTKKLRDRKSTRLNSSHIPLSRMPSSA